MPSSPTDPALASAARLFGRAFREFDPRPWSAGSPISTLALGVHSLRSGLFFAEGLPLLLTQRPGMRRAASRPGPDSVRVLLSRLREILERDADRIGRGVAPLSVLLPRDPLHHGIRLLRILADSLSVSARRKNRHSRDFGSTARAWLDDLPAYYRRNFHYQTDGYLSARSADLYEHQVEILFRGGADAMRRLILEPMKDHFGDHDGHGLHFLELGSGTGSASRSVARAFPRAKITCLDLSYPYTNHARRQLAAFPRVECVQGDAASLDFAADRFDAVYSVFLFHELPLSVRELVLDEAQRVLRPAGFFGFVDSLQKGDDEALDWALDFFPREFHEPYYAHYVSHPMEDLLEEAGFEDIRSETGYLAKCVSARARTMPATRIDTPPIAGPEDPTGIRDDQSAE